jgi:hypothetical protein
MAERGRPRRSILGILIPLALVVAVVAAVGSYAAVPDVRRQVDRTISDLRRQFLPELVEVHPSAAAAALPAIDGDPGTSWKAGGAQPGLTVRFGPAVDLGSIGVIGGADGEEFVLFRRPLRLRLESGDQSVTVDLDDMREFQSRRIDLRDVTRLRVIVENATQPRDAQVAIRELEFWEIR